MTRLSRTLLCCVLLTLLVSAGCGGGSGDDIAAGGDATTSTTDLADTTTTTTDPATTTTAGGTRPTTTATVAKTTSSTELSILRRRDARPADVAAQADYFDGGPPPHGFACENDSHPATSTPPTGALVITFVAPEMVAGEATNICVGNYQVGVPVTFEVLRAGTRVWKAEVAKPTADLGPSAVFNTMPLDPTGGYTVTVTQQTRKATKTFQLAIAHDQPLLVVAESPGRGVPTLSRGKAVHIGLAGWAARQRVALSLYRSTSTEHGGDKAPAAFIASFTVTVDGNGQLLHVIQTRVDDPTGCYVVNTRPVVEPQGALGRLGPSIVEFCLV